MPFVWSFLTICSMKLLAAPPDSGLMASMTDLFAASPRVAGWEDDLEDDANEVEEEVSAAMSIIAGRSGQSISDVEREVILNLLDQALAAITRIESPVSGESSGIRDAGLMMTGISPTTLAEYASECATLAIEANAEIASGTNFDRSYVGSRYKTLRHLIERSTPHSYTSMLIGGLP